MLKKSNFLSLIGSLAQKEFARFEMHLQCYHENKKIAMQVLEYIKPYYAKRDLENLNFDLLYEAIFREVLPDYPEELRKQKSKNLLNTFSDLFLWLKEFLICQKISTSSFTLEKDLIWLNILIESETKPKFSRQLVLLKESLKESLPKDIPSYAKKMIISYLVNYQLQMTLPPKKKKENPDQPSLPTFIDHLDSFYAITRLKLACEVETQKKVPSKIQKTSPEFQAAQLMASISPELAKSNPLLAIYFELFQLIVNRSQDSYEKAEALLKDNFSHISPVEQHTILIYLQNYAAAQIRQDKKEYLVKTHKLNVFGIEQNIFTPAGAIPPTHFLNIIHTACKAKEFKWAELYIKNYGSQLEAATREETTRQGQAVLAFEQGKYKRTLSLLDNLHIEDVLGQVRSRSLILISNWELKSDGDGIENYCIAFEQYLNRHKKNNPGSIIAALNFVKIVRKLIMRKIEKGPLIEEINEKKLLYNKDWLLEKAETYQSAAHKRR